jgi:iron complex outermembrane recepter protein
VQDGRQTFFTYVALDPALTDVVSTNPYSLPFPGQGLTSQTADTRSFAGFAQATYTPGFAEDKLHLTAGIRYTNDQKKFHRYLLGGDPVDITPAPFKASRFDPAFTAAYDLAPTVNIYARYAQAYRAGGASVRSPSFTPFGAEVNKSVEVGIKSDFFDHRVRVNGALFQNRISNRQATVQISATDPSLTDVINFPGVTRIRGGEAEVTVSPVSGMVFSGTYTYMKSRIPDVKIATDPNGIYYVANVPRHTFTIATDYTLPAWSFGQLAAHFDYAYATPYECTPRVGSDNYVYKCRRNVGNARLTLQNIELARGTKLRISGYVNNVFNQAYPIFVAPGATYYSAAPRTYGIEAGVSF